MISFIVPAHNEQEYIGPTLASIRSAADALGQPYEMIVVSDGSTDLTDQIAAAAGARVVPVNLRQISAVRNAGARHACGEFLFFVDADTHLPADTLAAAWRALQGRTIAGGALVTMDQLPLPFSARIALRVWNCLSRLRRWAAGCFVFVKREAFDAVGGFSEQFFAAEEIALSEALHRAGPFVILPRYVTTSARKLHTHRVRDHLSVMFKSMLTMGRSLQSREGLDLWYVRQPEPPPPEGGHEPSDGGRER